MNSMARYWPLATETINAQADVAESLSFEVEVYRSRSTPSRTVTDSTAYSTTADPRRVVEDERAESIARHGPPQPRRISPWHVEPPDAPAG